MSNYSLRYNVDIVFCIDCTESMDNVLNIIKERALSFYEDLLDRMRQKQKAVDALRVRVVAFRDYVAYDQERKKGNPGNEPMLVTDFFRLPEEAEKLELAVRSLQPRGGGDDPEDGLEAVAYAIRSDWDRSPGVKHRHVIVVWTDAQAHELGFGKASSRYPKGMARSIGELTAWWGTPSAPGYCLQGAKRLVLFTPKEEGWDFLTEQWDQTVQFPSKAGNGLSELDYEEILNCLFASL